MPGAAGAGEGGSTDEEAESAAARVASGAVGEPQRSTASEPELEAGFHKMLVQLQQAEGDGQGASTCDAGGQQGRPFSAATRSSGHGALEAAPQHRSSDICSFDESEWQTTGKQAAGATSPKHRILKQAPPAAKVCCSGGTAIWAAQFPLFYSFLLPLTLLSMIFFLSLVLLWMQKLDKSAVRGVSYQGEWMCLCNRRHRMQDACSDCASSAPCR